MPIVIPADGYVPPDLASWSRAQKFNATTAREALCDALLWHSLCLGYAFLAPRPVIVPIVIEVEA